MLSSYSSDRNWGTWFGFLVTAISEAVIKLLLTSIKASTTRYMKIQWKIQCSDIFTCGRFWEIVEIYLGFFRNIIWAKPCSVLQFLDWFSTQSYHITDSGPVGSFTLQQQTPATFLIGWQYVFRKLVAKYCSSLKASMHWNVKKWYLNVPVN